MYIISKDSPEQHAELHSAITERYGFSLPFVSDPDLELIDFMEMKNGDVAYRGYGILDSEGKLVFKSINDHWGEELDKTVEEIEEEYGKMN